MFSLLSSILTLSPPFKVSPPEKLTSITMYFFGNSSLLKSLSSIIYNFFCCLTSAFNLLSNFVTIFFTFSRSSFFSQLLCFTINLFYHTKYFTTLLTFILFSIFSTFHPSTSLTSTVFTFSTFYSPTFSLYHTTSYS